jgi:sulfoxide reductase heme-binding subunit YedZ
MPGAERQAPEREPEAGGRFRMSRRGRIALKATAWVLCLLPLAVLIHLAVQGELGANPISFVTNWLGQWTFRLLLVSLALTPLRILFGLAWPLQLRRLVGLFAFCYACLHLSVWVVLDHYFDWGEMWTDLLKRRYITAGVAALTLLVPLAATSTGGMVRRLGGAAWRRLHRLVYLVAVLAALHFLWLAKAVRSEQYVYAAIVALLLGIRLWDSVRRRLRRRRVPVTTRPSPA